MRPKGKRTRLAKFLRARLESSNAFGSVITVPPLLDDSVVTQRDRLRSFPDLTAQTAARGSLAFLMAQFRCRFILDGVPEDRAGADRLHPPTKLHNSPSPKESAESVYLDRRVRVNNSSCEDAGYASLYDQAAASIPALVAFPIHARKRRFHSCWIRFRNGLLSTMRNASRLSTDRRYPNRASGVSEKTFHRRFRARRDSKLHCNAPTPCNRRLRDADSRTMAPGGRERESKVPHQSERLAPA
jgi:hypothetical protein